MSIRTKDLLSLDNRIIPKLGQTYLSKFESFEHTRFRKNLSIVFAVPGLV